MNSKWEKLISLRPQVVHKFGRDKIYVNDEEVSCSSYNKWACLPINWEIISFAGEDATHFLCKACQGQNHKEHNNAPVEIKHPLHPKHSLLLVMLERYGRARKCFCCDEYLDALFYHCSACDFTLNVACVEKSPVLSIDHPKLHEHTLSLFSRTTSLTCDVCALAYSSCPLYICPPCGFVVHRRCFDLPRVIRISRHPHRISFTPSFHHGDWSCGVCRRNIENDYGGYSCIKDGCSYAAHSRCATQSNVWDGIELEGEPEEIEEEEVEPFVRISDGIIQHFSHQHHHLRLDENSGRDYDEDKLCQACITPIYFGNFYSCMQCDFILHEKCAELFRKIHHPIHPHMLTLVAGYNGVVNYCSACHWFSTTGFFYRCEKEECDFQLDVQCATVLEPLVHESHMHPLFLTSKPGEERICSVCKERGKAATHETFNCIEACNFALCFRCATLPHKLRYKHDKHILTLSYGKEKSTRSYWCEACESKIYSKDRFYMCDEYCCVTLHINCMLGRDKYMEPGSSWLYRGNPSPSWYKGKMVCNLPNNHHMSRPSCSVCKRRCPYKIVFECSGSIYCSIVCIRY